MTWLVTGANGQLGMAFQREIASSADVRFVDRSACNLADPVSLKGCLNRHQPSVIINCAAYTAVAAAEEDQAKAMRVNADAVGEMARWAIWTTSQQRGRPTRRAIRRRPPRQKTAAGRRCRRRARRGIPVHPSARVDSYVPSATCQLWRPKDFEQRSKRAAIGCGTSTRAS